MISFNKKLSRAVLFSSWNYSHQVEDQQLVAPTTGQPNNSHVFTAHQSSLAALSINQSGTMVATASEQGIFEKSFDLHCSAVRYYMAPYPTVEQRM